jgi:uncharacterized protein YraI
LSLVAVLREGDALTVLGKSADAGWLQVRTEDGKTGWVAAAYVTLATPLDRVAVAAAPPTPAACSIAVADDFFGRWNRAELGCPSHDQRRRLVGLSAVRARVNVVAPGHRPRLCLL